ncbi:hypothetical protein RYX36_025924 [Vicia faba]
MQAVLLPLLVCQVWKGQPENCSRAKGVNVEKACEEVSSNPEPVPLVTVAFPIVGTATELTNHALKYSSVVTKKEVADDHDGCRLKLMNEPSDPRDSGEGCVSDEEKITLSADMLEESSNPASPLNSVHTIGSPAQPSIEPSSGVALSPVRSSDISSSQLQSKLRGGPSVENNDITNSNLRQLRCKIILTDLEFSLKPVTYAGIFNHMLNWLVNWDQRQHGVYEAVILKSWRLDKTVIAWLYSCLDVIWLLVDEGKCRVPFYELLRSDFQFIENIPNDEALFTLTLVIQEPGQLVEISLNAHGTRVVQKLIETLETGQQISLVVSALEPGSLTLIKDLHGNHVVQHCLECLSNEDNKFIYVAAVKYCVEIATHQTRMLCSTKMHSLFKRGA